MIPIFGDHTDALIQLLAGLGQPVGDADATSFVPPYLVVDRGPSPVSGFTMDGPYDEAYIEYQVSCVGDSRKASDGLADAVRALVIGFDSVAGRSIANIECINSRAASRNVAGGELWFTAIEEFKVWTTP